MTTTTTHVYGPERKAVDVHRPDGPAGPRPVVLLWHGRGPDEREVLAPLGRAAAALGVLVVVPDWRSDAADGGRGHLLASAGFARELAGPAPLVLAGWSMGARAAVAVALGPGAFDGFRPHAVVALAGSYATAAASTGTVPLDDLRTAARDVPVHLLHGTADTVVPAERSRDLHAALRARSHPATHRELPTDHAGLVLTAYSPAADRCLPTTAPHALAAGRAAAQALAAAAR
ncbi:alpha/beta hydrolase [Kitasatospora sp. YST-16]|uniref:alpha/beta hydrolase n=1 Tax=unclassified Kitasatospora TaxID=2633591 RepID=UPI0005607B73|nr:MULTISPECIES: alpha/beta hydrolase [unclassified Kitasatospora]WAL75022.1 alpha/beta hydrolase [Kitasatospora sp. YST-16]WNW41077.1 alpha/beta hydrolase [Streptomyces sp. Li-HN-5-13]